MPEPIPDLSRDQQCHHYQAPSGQRCGSPALKGEYYCYHHHIKHANRKNHRVLIDPEVTCMEVPLIEDRASIFIALAAVIHRLAENTVDTRRAGQMIYALQVALQALGPVPAPAANHQPVPATQPAVIAERTINKVQRTTPPPESASAAPVTIPISKQSLLYFRRSRHCAHCNAELFPASQLTERANPGAPPSIIEEARPALPAPNPSPAEIPADVSGTLPSLHAGCPVLTALGRDAATPTPPTAENEHRSTVNGSRRRVPRPCIFRNRA
jgi:hypothetical protein